MSKANVSVKKKISVVVPCYNEESALPAFFDGITELVGSIPDYEWEFLFVDDGSTDRTLALLTDFASSDRRAVVVEFSRNFGKEAALSAGLEYASGDAVIPIDADLQDPPELIHEMIAFWKKGVPVVVAKRGKRQNDTLFKRATAGAFYQLHNAIGDVHIAENAGDFRLMDRVVVDAINLLPERNRFMKGLFSWPGFEQAEVRYDRPERKQGNTKFDFWKLWNFALDGLTSFSTVPLRVWTYVGLCAALLAFLWGAVLIVRTLFFGVDVPGYASLMVVVLFMGALQLLSLGVIGEYLGRTYQEVKQRPLYIVRNVHRATAPPASAGTKQG